MLIVASKDTMMITTIIIEIEAHIMDERILIITIASHIMRKETEIGTINQIDIINMSAIHMTGEKQKIF